MKIIRTLEIAWLLIAIAGAAFGTYKFVTLGWNEAYILYIFTIVAGIFYYIRRRQRIKMEQDNRPVE